jgi:predicted phosphodiesterase
MFSRVALIFAILLLSFPLGMRLAGERVQETPLGEVDFSLALHPSGAGEFYVPLADWGVEVNLFNSPLLLKADPRGINRDNLLLLAEGESGMLQESKESIIKGISFLIVQNLLSISLFLLLFSFIAASLFSFARKKFIRDTFLAGAALSFALAAVTFLTYSPEAIEEPRFYARGAELKQLVQVVNREISEDKGSYASEFDRVLRGMGRFLSASQTTTEGKSSRQALLFSDLHANALVLPSLEDFAGKDPVFFVGDFAHQGNDAESLLLSKRIASLSNRVIAVSGNHDSESLMLALAKKGVTVLGQKGQLLGNGTWKKGLITVGPWRVAGYRDPLEWRGKNPDDPERIFSFQEISDSAFVKEKKKVITWWDSLVEKPDIVLIHQEALALALADHVKKYDKKLTILTGHTHEPALVRINNISVINSGAAGAGGLFGIGTEEGELASLHFDKKALRYVDFVSVDPLKGAARAERVNVEEEVCDKFCSYKPNRSKTVRLGTP